MMGRVSRNWIKAKARAFSIPTRKPGRGAPIIWPMEM